MLYVRFLLKHCIMLMMSCCFCFKRVKKTSVKSCLSEGRRKRKGDLKLREKKTESTYILKKKNICCVSAMSLNTLYLHRSSLNGYNKVNNYFILLLFDLRHTTECMCVLKAVLTEEWALVNSVLNMHLEGQEMEETLLNASLCLLTENYSFFILSDLLAPYIPPLT